MATLGSLVVSLTANTAQFTSDLGKAAHEAEKRMKDISDGAEKMANIATGALIAVTGAAALLVKQAINSADAMGKMAQSTGIAVETLSELVFAANLSEVGTEALSTSISRLNRNISDAAAGTGEARKAFDALQISVRDSEGNLKNADQVLEEVADQFAQMEDGAGKSALAMMLFGRAGAQMIPLLNEGAAGIREMRREAHDLGLTISRDTAKVADAFNNNLTRLAAVKDGLANSIMRNLLPALRGFSDEAVRAAKETRAIEETALIVTNTLKLFATLAIGAGAAIKIAGDSIAKWAFAVNLAAHGEFREAMKLMSEDSADMASVIEGAVNLIKKLWDDAGTAATRAAEEQRKALKPAPGIEVDGSGKAMADMTAMIEESRAQQEQAIAATIQAQKELVKAEEQAQLDLQAMKDESHQQQMQQVAETLAARKEILDDYRAGLTERMAALIDSNRTEFEVLQEDYAQKRLLLREYLTDMESQLVVMHENGLINEETYQQQLTEVQARYYDAQLRMEHQFQGDLSNIVERGGTQREAFMALSMDKQAKTIFSELAGITAGVAQHNKALFELNKVAGISMAIINAYEGISLTMAKYPYPLNIAMAAAHAVAAFAQVDAIRSATFGGGAAAPSLIGTTPAPPVTPVAPTPSGGGQTTIINLQGDSFSRQSLQDLVDQLNEGFGDGHRVILT